MRPKKYSSNFVKFRNFLTLNLYLNHNRSDETSINFNKKSKYAINWKLDNQQTGNKKPENRIPENRKTG